VRPHRPDWAPHDVRAHIDLQHTLYAELLERVELVDAQGLAGPDVAKVVVSDGINPPRIMDGPSPKSKELLAGYRPVASTSAALSCRSPSRTARGGTAGSSARACSC
jgi:hypothetical protein